MFHPSRCTTFLCCWVALLALGGSACRSNAEADAPDTASISTHQAAVEAKSPATAPAADGSPTVRPPIRPPHQPPVVEEVVFHHRTLPQGTARREQSRTTMQMNMVVKAHDEVLKKGQTTRENIEHKQVTILATDTLGQVTQAKVVYTELVEIRTEGEQSPQRSVNPLNGKTYIATLADGAMTIKDAQGADVPSGEADEVIAGNGDLLQPNTLHKLIPQGAIAVGTKLPIEKTLLAQLFELDEPGALEIEEAWMILREVREIQGQRAGVFETELTLSAVIDKLKMSFDLSGQLSVALANGHLVELTLDGPVRFTTPQDPQQPNWVELEGHGSITMHKQLSAVQP